MRHKEKDLGEKNKTISSKNSDSSPTPRYEKPKVICHAAINDLTFCSGAAAAATGSSIIPTSCPITEDDIK